MNLLRLFTGYRLLEAELERERTEHRREVEEIRADADKQIAYFKEQLDDERNERRRLQDRLLQKNGALPVFEPVPERHSSDHVKPVANKSAYRRVVERGKEASDKLYESVKAEAEEFVRKQSTAS